MTTLLSELVRILSTSAARELRERAEGAPLSRAEMMAVATLSELSAAYLTSTTPPPAPANLTDWAALEKLAEFDATLIEAARKRQGRTT